VSTPEAGAGASVDAVPLPARTRRIEPLVRIAGIVVSVLATIVTAVLELLLAPLRVGGTLIGVAAVLAVVANLAISWFAFTTVGRRWAVGPPWAIWTLIMFFAVSVRTTEGDYLVSGDNWVGLVMVLVGSLVFAVYMYRLILRGPVPAAPRAQAPPSAGTAPGPVRPVTDDAGQKTR
jgi:hypothetical protein